MIGELNIGENNVKKPGNVTNLSIAPADTQLTLKWKDPIDIDWQGTRVVYKVGSYPANPYDGTLLVDNTIRDAYENGLVLTDLVNDTEYFFRLFPYSTGWNTNEENKISGIPRPIVIAPFATATDEEIETMLEQHYNGVKDISTIFNIGDTRVIHINALSSPVAGSNKAHVAQDMTFRIIGFSHDTLTTPINGATKAAVTIECRELLGNNGSQEYDYLSGDSSGSSYENPTNFSTAYRRTWLNNNFVNALPSTFSPLIKTVKKANLQAHNTSSVVETDDKAFLLSYPEVFSSSYNNYRSNSNPPGPYEGTQYEWYNQNDSRSKYWNNNGVGGVNSYHWWLRSPASYSDSYWCRVRSNGNADSNYYSSNSGLSPALCL